MILLLRKNRSKTQSKTNEAIKKCNVICTLVTFADKKVSCQRIVGMASSLLVSPLYGKIWFLSIHQSSVLFNEFELRAFKNPLWTTLYSRMADFVVVLIFSRTQKLKKKLLIKYFSLLFLCFLTFLFPFNSEIKHFEYIYTHAYEKQIVRSVHISSSSSVFRLWL